MSKSDKPSRTKNKPMASVGKIVKPVKGGNAPVNHTNMQTSSRDRKYNLKDNVIVLAQVLDQKLRKPESKMTSHEKIVLIEEGISKKALKSLKEAAGLDYDQLSQILNVARATLINKKEKEKFSKDVSDKILGLAEIYSYGYEVFEDRDKFNQWIFRTNRALGGQSPFDLLDSSFGREEVKNLVGRIDYGVYS